MIEEIEYGIYGNSVLYMLFLCKSKTIPNLNVSFLESQPFLPTTHLGSVLGLSPLSSTAIRPTSPPSHLQVSYLHLLYQIL